MKQLESIERLTDSFEHLPSIGHRTAERLAYSILDLPEDTIKDLIKNIEKVKTSVHECPVCGLLTDKEICDVCNDEYRNKDTLIVVSTSKNALAIEKSTDKFKYHVLKGDISLLKNITPDKLNFTSLLSRIKEQNIKEIIIATNPTVEGETTAHYLTKLLEGTDVIITRLATGLPMGGELDYIDSLTIDRAINGRTKIK